MALFPKVGRNPKWTWKVESGKSGRLKWAPTLTYNIPKSQGSSIMRKKRKNENTVVLPSSRHSKRPLQSTRGGAIELMQSSQSEDCVHGSRVSGSPPYATEKVPAVAQLQLQMLPWDILAHVSRFLSFGQACMTCTLCRQLYSLKERIIPHVSSLDISRRPLSMLNSPPGKDTDQHLNVSTSQPPKTAQRRRRRGIQFYQGSKPKSAIHSSKASNGLCAEQFLSTCIKKYRLSQVSALVLGRITLTVEIVNLMSESCPLVTKISLVMDPASQSPWFGHMVLKYARLQELFLDLRLLPWSSPEVR